MSEKYSKFKNPEMTYLFYKALAFFIICTKCESQHQIMFKEEELIEILKILGLIKNI